MGRPTRVILLVEDNVIARNNIRNIFEGDGYTVMIAAEAAEALELSQRHEGPIDVLVTDVEMPHLDGVSLYAQITEERPEIRSVFLTDTVASLLEFSKSLPSLQRPFEPHTLRAKVKATVDALPSARKKQFVILVVDHKESRRLRTRKILVNHGYRVLMATSAEEAEALSDTAVRIDLVVSAVVFPGRSGVHLAEHITASEREISTLLISHNHPDVLHEMEGFSKQPEFLPNPFTPEALLIRVSRLLGK